VVKVVIDFDVVSGSLFSVTPINGHLEICACHRLHLCLPFSLQGAIRLNSLVAHFYEWANCNEYHLGTFEGLL